MVLSPFLVHFQICTGGVTVTALHTSIQHREIGVFSVVIKVSSLCTSSCSLARDPCLFSRSHSGGGDLLRFGHSLRGCQAAGWNALAHDEPLFETSEVIACATNGC